MISWKNRCAQISSTRFAHKDIIAWKNDSFLEKKESISFEDSHFLNTTNTNTTKLIKFTITMESYNYVSLTIISTSTLKLTSRPARVPWNGRCIRRRHRLNNQSTVVFRLGYRRSARWMLSLKPSSRCRESATPTVQFGTLPMWCYWNHKSFSLWSWCYIVIHWFNHENIR